MRKTALLSLIVASLPGCVCNQPGVPQPYYSDNGDTWTVYPGTEGNYLFAAFSRQNPDLFYLGRESDSLRSRDGGRTWDDPLKYPIKANFTGNGDVVYSVRYVDGGWGSEVIRSRDRGETWQPIPDRSQSIQPIPR